MLRNLKSIIKTKKFIRNISEKKIWEENGFNSKFEYEYIQRMESIEDGFRKGLVYIGFTMIFCGWTISNSIKNYHGRHYNLNGFYGLKGIENALLKIAGEKE